jgi:PKD repeat protein
LINLLLEKKRKMKKLILSFLCIGSLVTIANAQLSIDAASTTYTINFDGTVNGVSNGGYMGNGFSPTPAYGALDSDAWEIDEDGTMLNFGDTQNSAGSTFAQGLSVGGSASTGFQAFEVAVGDTAFGIQPTGGTFTPGYVILKVYNNSGATITEFNINYDVYVYNDNDRGNTLNFSYSTNNSVFNAVPSVDFTSPGTADVSPIWMASNKNATISGLNIPNASYFYVRWSGADDSGSGPRDEFALDNIAISASTSASTIPVAEILNTAVIESEGVTTANVAIQLTNANGTPSIVKLLALDGSTANLSDYTMPISLVFPGNVDTTMNFEITILDDMDMEVTEYIALVMVDSSNVLLGNETMASIYIKDNDYSAPIANGSIELLPIFTYTVPNGSAEISAYDPLSQKLYVGNSTANTIEVLDVSNPSNGILLQSISVSSYGNLNSVACWGDTIAVAVENGNNPQLDGSVVFLDAAGGLLNQVTVGAMPDMVTFTPDHSKVLSANEGEPDDNYAIDPEGSISIIDISAGVVNASVTNAMFTSFNAQQVALEAAGVNIYGPNATVAQDLEPEYITVNESSTIAWITLQENNALAKLDIATATITDIYPLGYKDHSLPGNGMDISNDANEILIANWPTKGMYQPDAIASYSAGGSTYLVTANEGDARDYNAIAEEERIGDGSYPLDSATFFEFAAFLKDDNNGGRLKTTNSIGDIDNDGDFDELYSFGARSFSIWDENGNLIYDSGDDFEQITAADPNVSNIFNCSNDNISLKNRSDDKGPEPEGVAVGVINDTTYAFITLERVGGVMVYDVSDATNPKFVQYINNRDINAVTGDLAPEGIIFVSDEDSPIDTALVIVSNEVSGTVTIYKVNHTIILPPVADFSQDMTSICAGEIVTFTNTSTGIQDSWEWTFVGGTPSTSTLQNPVVTYATSGNFPVKLVVLNVNGSDTIEMSNHITVSPIPTAPIITQIDATTLQSSQVTGNQWNDINGFIQGETGQTFNPANDGDYAVTYTDNNGCSVTSPFFSYSNYSNVDEFATESLVIYPNPAYHILNFNFIATIAVYNINGKAVMHASEVQSIDISLLEPGMYTIRTTEGQNIKFIKK